MRYRPSHSGATKTTLTRRDRNQFLMPGIICSHQKFIEIFDKLRASQVKNETVNSIDFCSFKLNFTASTIHNVKGTELVVSMISSDL